MKGLNYPVLLVSVPHQREATAAEYNSDAEIIRAAYNVRRGMMGMSTFTSIDELMASPWADTTTRDEMMDVIRQNVHGYDGGPICLLSWGSEGSSEWRYQYPDQVDELDLALDQLADDLSGLQVFDQAEARAYLATDFSKSYPHQWARITTLLENWLEQFEAEEKEED